MKIMLALELAKKIEYKLITLDSKEEMQVIYFSY